MDRRAKKIWAVCLTMAVVLTMLAVNSLVSADTINGGVPAGRASSTSSIQGSTSYEEITDIGFYPQERRIEAIVSVKRTSGFNGREYVAFWIDFNNDSIFSTNEYVGTGSVWTVDPGTANAWALPLRHAVYTDVAIPTGVTPGKIVRARAILSWNTPPTGPNFNGTYGNTVNRTIQLDPVR